MFHCGYTGPPGDGWSVVEVDILGHTLIPGQGQVSHVPTATLQAGRFDVK
jgi:hypothetical protein